MPNYQIIAPDTGATTYDIYDDAARLITLDGRGIPNTSRRLRTSPGIDGALDKGYILGPRRMDLRIFYSESTPALADAKRDELYEIFRPFDKPFTLKVTRDDGAVRQIECHLEGIFDVPDSELFGQNAQVISTRLIAPDPIWYDPTQQIVDFALSGASTGTQGDLSSDYEGNWFEKPVVRVYGAIDDPLFRLNIQNYTTESGSSISYTVQTISGTQTITDGDYWEYDLQAGQVTVKQNGSTDKMSSINPTSDLAEFRIWPEDLYTNSVYMSWTGTPGANAKLQYRFYNRYIGI